jgi:hypothetical protein
LTESCFKVANFSQTKTNGKILPAISLRFKRRLLYGKLCQATTGKELNSETGLYYYGARYLDSKTGRWLSADPALGEYIPGAPVNDEARKRNQNLPGMEGVFNVVNLHLYHYAGNNPLKYTDPDGKNIHNNTDHWIIVREEHGKNKAIKPGETYYGEADGILLHDGSTFKINDGNSEGQFYVDQITDNNGGSIKYEVVGDIKAKLNHETGNLKKDIFNRIPFLKNLEKAGMYQKGDGSVAGDDWWDAAMHEIKAKYEDISDIDKWDDQLKAIDKEGIK